MARIPTSLGSLGHSARDLLTSSRNAAAMGSALSSRPFPDASADMVMGGEGRDGTRTRGSRGVFMLG